MTVIAKKLSSGNGVWQWEPRPTRHSHTCGTQELPSFEELMNPPKLLKDSQPVLSPGPIRTAVLAKTRKFVASPDTQDQALALYVNSQVQHLVDALRPRPRPFPSPQPPCPTRQHKISAPYWCSPQDARAEKDETLCWHIRQSMLVRCSQPQARPFASFQALAARFQTLSVNGKVNPFSEGWLLGAVVRTGGAGVSEEAAQRHDACAARCTSGGQNRGRCGGCTVSVLRPVLPGHIPGQDSLVSVSASLVSLGVDSCISPLNGMAPLRGVTSRPSSP